MRGSRHRQAFTLTEVVICVAVLVILVAVLVPAVSRARAQSRVVTCTANLRQIDVATRAWSQKFNDMRLPGASWPGAVESMTDPLTSARILACPDALPFYSVTNTTLPPGTDPPEFFAEVLVKNNGGHPVEWTQVNENQWIATKWYHKDAKPSGPQKATFTFDRVAGNDWVCTPTYIYPDKYKGVEPPIHIHSVFNDVMYYDVKVGQTYAITGSPVSPVTTTEYLLATSYGQNTLMDNRLLPKGKRVRIMDYNKLTVIVDSDAPGTYLIGRHYGKSHNVLFTDGSVELLNVKDLDFSRRDVMYLPQ